jgi:prevent-host-death family protein
MNTLSSLLPANVARSHFYQILDDVVTQLRQFTITHRGHEQAVVMSFEEYAGWLETLEIMGDKKLLSSIDRGLKSKKRYSQKEVDALLKW